MVPLIGIDPSLTGTGIAVWQPTSWDPSDVQTATVTSSAKDGGSADPARLRKLARGVFSNLAGMLDVKWPEPWFGLRGLVVMEGLAYANVTGNVLDLAGWRGVLAYGLASRGFVLVDHVRQPPRMVKGKKVTPPDPTGKGVSPTTLKMYALGKGAGTGTDKDAMVIAAKDRFSGIQFANNNEADALFLMDMAYTHYFPDMRRGITDKGMTALDTVDWPDLGVGV